MKKQQFLDVSKLKPIDKLDNEELAIHKALIDGQYKSIDGKANRTRYAKIFKHSYQRSRANLGIFY